MATLTALWGWRSALIIVGLAGALATLAVATQARHLDALPTRSSPSHRPVQTGLRGGLATLLSPATLLFFAFMVLTSFANSGLNNFSVSVLVTDYGADLPGANVVLTLYFAASTAGILIGGILADRIRRHEMILVIGFLLAASALALIASVKLPIVVIGGVFMLTGLVFGAIRPSRDMMVRAVAPDGSVGKVFGFVTMGLNVGGALAPMFFGWLVDRGAAAWVFYAAGAVMLLALVGGRRQSANEASRRQVTHRLMTCRRRANAAAQREGRRLAGPRIRGSGFRGGVQFGMWPNLTSSTTIEPRPTRASAPAVLPAVLDMSVSGLASTCKR